MRTREEHLVWCKERALEYLNRGDLQNAVTSMGSDLQKHPALECPPHLLMLGGIRAMNFDTEGVRKWIEGFR